MDRVAAPASIVNRVTEMRASLSSEEWRVSVNFSEETATS